LSKIGLKKVVSVCILDSFGEVFTQRRASIETGSGPSVSAGGSACRSLKERDMSKCVIGAALAVAGLALSADAAVIVPGLYQLNNHPDGNASPPLYGLRLDELYNATGGHDIYTFDFNAAGSNVQMVVTASTIRIYGSAMGGRDMGGTYAADLDAGLYTFDFLYNIGVSPALGGDDDVVVYADMQNFGWIQTARGDVINLVDKSDGNYSFRLGDENNDAGHRGFAGISGWGWLNHGPPGSPHIAASDWLFTARLVPTPGTAALLGLGGLFAARRRRQD
jgi:hypothetical protein